MSRANDEVARLSIRWREIEFWLKRAEQVNQKAIIPAINELRYASRQMLLAVTKMRKETLTTVDKRQITKRLSIAEQYLFNAEHDIIDSITTYYERFVSKLDADIGPTAVTVLYTGYPLMRDKLKECRDLIAEARLEYEKRQENYGRMKADHLPFLIDSYRTLTDAEVRARHQQDQLNAQLIRAKAKIGILEKTTIAGTVFGAIALPLSFYFWLVTKDEHCKNFGSTPVLNLVCPALSRPSALPRALQSSPSSNPRQPAPLAQPK